MSLLFGNKEPREGAVLLLDVENGSVAAALLQTSADGRPGLIGEQRVSIPLLHARDGATLGRAVEKAARAALQHLSELTVRLRHQTAQEEPRAARAALFLAAPWGRPNMAAGKPDYTHSLADTLRGEIAATFGDIPAALHTGVGAALHGTRTLFPDEQDFLICSISGEVTELLLVTDGIAVQHATLPHGLHLLLRTLRAHGGLSEAEARSALRLGHHEESLAAAGRHYAEEFAAAVRALQRTGPADHVYVLSNEPSADWFAKALSEDIQVSELFPNGGTVRAVQAHQASPLFHSHAPTPDVHLMLDALYAQALGCQDRPR